MRKRSLAALLACVMVISLLPTAALAAPPENVESAEGYRISSCTMNGEEKLGTTGPVQFTHLKAGDKILTEMETFQALDVVYISDSGNDANSGASSEATVKTWEQAYSLLSDGGTIVVVGMSTAPSAKIDSTAPMAGKRATITGSYGSVSGGTLVPTTDGMTNGLSFGADTTLEDLTIDCSQNPNKYGMFSFYANGHDLTIGDGMDMIPFPNSVYSPYPMIFAGGTNLGQLANSNTLIVKSGQYAEISTNEESGSSSGASLYLYGGVAVDYVNSEYGTGGEIHIEEGSEAQPVIIGNIYLTYEDEVGLDSLWIHGGGYLRLIGDTAAVKDLTIQSGGVLEFENPQMDDVTFNSLTGGGTLVLPSGACLAVTGSVTGDTSLRILPGTESGDGYVDGIALGTYVTAAPDSTGGFILENQIKAALQKETAAGGTNWTLVQVYAVVFDSQGGTAVKTQYVVPGERAIRPADPTWSGHDFDGWYLEGGLYDFAKPITSDITLTAHWTDTSWVAPPDTSGDGGGEDDARIRFDSNGGTRFDPIDEDGRSFSLNVYDDEEYGAHIPTRPGYRFTGWYKDSRLTIRVDEDETLRVTSSVTLFAGWTETSVPGMLNGDDHYAYIQGYSDGSVRPNANITRAQVATIFFRLLDENVRDDNLTTSNAFPDVNEDYWANTAISTMARLGVINGRNSGLFDPDANITRAEFAAICARFDDSGVAGVTTFTDTADHWAEDEISRAAALGWIQGYSDDSFRPDQYISRAQAVTMINRVLCRLPEDTDDLLSGMNTWTDCHESDWFYLAIQEATNSHDFVTKDWVYESWTDLNRAPDWSRYE